MIFWPNPSLFKGPALFQFNSAQSLSRVQLFATPWTTARQASLSIANSRNLLKFMSIESVMPSNHLILWRPLLLTPSVFPSIRVFSNKSILHIRWPEYWSFSFSINPSSEYSGLISFRMDWLDLLETKQCVHSHPKLPNYPFPNLPLPTPATISLFSKSVSLFLFCK